MYAGFRVVLIIAAGWVIAPGAVCQPSPLFFRTDYFIGASLDAQTAAVAIADFNHDGKPDFAVGSRLGINIFLNNGDGTISLSSASESQSGGLAAADFDGDGNADLILYSPTVVVMLPGNGDGTFGTARTLASPSGLVYVQVADLNGDKRPDLLVMTNSGNPFNSSATATVTVLLNSGSGTFAPGKTLALSSRQAGKFVVGDFNHDGIPDLALAVYGIATNFASPPTGYVSIALGHGDGSFSTPAEVLTLPQPANFIAAADFNHDGVSDLAVGDVNTMVLLGNGDGSFRQAPGLNLNSALSTIAAVDWTGAGNPGVAVSSLLGGITIMGGNGDGTFYPAGTAATYDSGQLGSFAVADLNGDGLPDLVATTSLGPGSSVVSVLLNAGPRLPLLFVTSSAASGVNSVAPSSLATVYGSFPLIPTPVSSATPVPNLGGVTVMVKDSAGVSRPAPLIYISSSQINLEIPAGTASGVATVTLLTSGPPMAGSALVRNAIPGIFTVGNGLPAAYAVTYGPDNQPQTPVLVSPCGSNGCSPAPISRPAGSRVFLELYGTGFRNHVSPVMATINGMLPVPLTIAPAYAGAQGQFEGLDQVNVEITNLQATPPPVGGPPGTRYFLVLQVDGLVSNQVTFAVQ